MIKFVLYLTCICLFICSCSDSQKQSDNQKYILGDWITVSSSHGKRVVNKKNTGDVVVVPPPYLTKIELSFISNSTFKNRLGYFDQNSPRHFLGTESKFELTTDSLKLLNLTNSNWDAFKVVKLSPDSLILEKNGLFTCLAHPTLAKDTTLVIDKIILSTSGCYGSCPVLSITIQADGNVLFDGLQYTTKTGLSQGSISVKLYNEILSNFKKSGLSHLQSDYAASHTDDETISVTFESNGKIYKTVSDYGSEAPTYFKWAYLPLRYLYQSIELKPCTSENVTYNLHETLSSKFWNDNKYIQLEYSERFLLYSYLQKGVQTTVKFKPRYKIRVYKSLDYDSYHWAETDGRNFSFIIDNKPVTIDIGFNFVELNMKSKAWIKAGEFDY